MDSAKQSLTTLSLCTGYGGIERGLELAGEQLDVLAHVEIEAFAIANLVAKMEQGKLAPSPIWSNLKTLPVEPFRDRVDLITGGYPCQPFSAAGKRQGNQDEQGRHLWPYIRDIIRAVRPVRVFCENVEGHITIGLREVISDLESLGYTTAFGIFSAAEVGAPHQRKRVYIMANSSSAGLSERDGSRASTKRQPFAESECGGGVRTELADSNSAGQHPNKRQPRPPEAGNDAGWRSAKLADSQRERSQGGLSRREDTQRESELRHTGSGSSAHGQPRQETRWDAEPNVGRVVDGCANRVDRIRLLGNSVVPQTAAKAWQVLNDELSN